MGLKDLTVLLRGQIVNHESRIAQQPSRLVDLGSLEVCMPDGMITMKD